MVDTVIEKELRRTSGEQEEKGDLAAAWVLPLRSKLAALHALSIPVFSQLKEHGGGFE